MSGKINPLRYIARVKLKKDVRKNREASLKFMDWVKTIYPQAIGGPNLSYVPVAEEEPGKWMFYYFENKKDSSEFKSEILEKSLAIEVSLGAVKPSFVEEINPKASKLEHIFR